jgi:elongation factor G
MSRQLLKLNCTRPEFTARIAAMRNLGIIAHIDAGKTTCTERILYFAGAQHSSGDVHDGTTTTDYDPDEQKRGITIKAACVSCGWNGHALNLIDTPGHIDFTVEVQRSLAVLDGAVVVFSAVQGVEAQSETVWRQADRFSVPRLCFVNKMDSLGANFLSVVEQIRSRLGGRPLPVQMPVGSEQSFCGVIDLVRMRQFCFAPESMGANVTESAVDEQYLEDARQRQQQLVALVADCDAEIGELFLSDKEPNALQLEGGVRRVCVKGAGFPVVCGSAYCYIGVQQLLDAVVAYLPSPLDRSVIGTDPEDLECPIERQADVAQPFAGLAFKTLHDNYGMLTLMRIYSGTLRKGDRVLNTRRNKNEKIERLYLMQADRAISIAEANAGQIVAVSGLRNTVTGDTLCFEAEPILLEAPSFRRR